MKPIVICKSFTFDAAHRLDRLPETHKCHRLHGHTYRVELELAGDVDPVTGMFVDYDDLASIVAPVIDRLDHRYLNEIPGLEVSTTENVAMWLYRNLDNLLSNGYALKAVRVYESSTTWAEVRW